MKKNIFVIILTMIIVQLFAVASALAVEDGIYNIGNSTSYVNPDTGRTEDGGSDLDIGEAMARSLTQQLMLYEVKGDKQYLTIRTGLSSYIRGARISVQGAGSGYQPVPFDIVKSNKGTDTIEYKFEIDSPDSRIKFSSFVEPMNRDVVFFITPNSSSIKSDTGAFAASDKADTGYSAGFVGNAKEGKMPTIVEELTGVAEVKKDKVTSVVNEKKPNEEKSSKQSDPSLSSTEEEKAKNENENLKTEEEESVDVADIDGVESEKLETDESDQGLTQFDSEGKMTSGSGAKEKSSNKTSIIIISVVILILGSSVGYVYYIRNKKSNK